MAFYRSLPADRPKSWFDEFSAEIKSDHKQLLECRRVREKRGDWSFDHAVMRTREFYVDRITGYRRVESITQDECDALLDLVAKLGLEDFPPS